MSPRDPFEAGQDATEELRRALEAIRQDVRAVVQDEVARAGISEADLERLVAELVRKHAPEPRKPAAGWRAPLMLAAGLAVGAVGGALGYRLLAGPATAASTPPGESDAALVEGGGVAAPPESVAAAPSPEPAATAAELAARFDSLFESHDPELEPLLADLQGTAAQPVLSALAAWRAGTPLEAGPRRRLHDALVQAAVNRLAGAGLALDGLVTRDPCGGASCGAVLQLWETRGGELGLPSYPPDDSTRNDALPVVERVLVMRGLEAAGG